MFINKWGNWKDITIISKVAQNALVQMRVNNKGKKQFRTVDIKGSIYSNEIPILTDLIVNK